MPAARRTGCGAALWLWLVSSVLCRGWTAPSASHDDTSNKPKKRKFLEAVYKDSPTNSRKIKDHIVLDGGQVLNRKHNEETYDETSSVSPDSLHSGQQNPVRTCLEAVVIDLTAEEDATVGDVSITGETAPQIEGCTSELEMTLERKCTPFRQSVGVQWINSNNLCWLDCILSALVHSEVVKDTVMIDLCSKEESVFWNLFTKYNQASMLYTSQLDRVKDGYCKKLTSEIFAKIETCLNEVRDKIFIRLQPKLRCTLGDMESPVFAFPLLLKTEPCIKKLFTYSFSWNFECSYCGYKYQNRCMKNLVTFTNVMPEWHPLNAAHFGPCNNCNSKSQIRKMVLEKVSPIFMLHFVEGLPHNNLQQYSFLFKGCLYQITSIIQYHAHNHFITWILNDDGSWLECDDIKGPCCERHEKFEVPASEIHIVIWEGKTSQMADKTSARLPLQNPEDQQTLRDAERVAAAVRSVGDGASATTASGPPPTNRAAAPNSLPQDEAAARRRRLLSGLRDLIGRNTLPSKRKRTQVNAKGFLLENAPVAKPGVVKTNVLQSQESLMAPLMSAPGKEKLTQDQVVHLNFPSQIVQLNTENTTFIKPAIDPIQGAKSIEIEDTVALEADAPLKQFLSPKTKKLKLEDVTPQVSNLKKKETATFAQTITAKSLQTPSLKETQKKPFVRSLFEGIQSKRFSFMPPQVSAHNRITITDLQPSVKGRNSFGGFKNKRKNQEDNWASKKPRFCASKPPAASAPPPSHPPSASTASIHTEVHADQEGGKNCEDAL